MVQNLSGESIKTSNIEKYLKTAKEYKNEITITTNRVYINNDLSEQDRAEILFVENNTDNTYIYNYKEANKEAPKSFNSGFMSKKMNLPIGDYRVYVKINDEYYDANLIVRF